MQQQVALQQMQHALLHSLLRILGALLVSSREVYLGSCIAQTDPTEIKERDICCP